MSTPSPRSRRLGITPNRGIYADKVCIGMLLMPLASCHGGLYQGTSSDVPKDSLKIRAALAAAGRTAAFMRDKVCIGMLLMPLASCHGGLYQGTSSDVPAPRSLATCNSDRGRMIREANILRVEEPAGNGPQRLKA
jgi:hypothetical protein